MDSTSVNLGPVVSDVREFSTYFKDSQSSLNVGHCNCQSIRPAIYSTKFSELRNLIQNSPLDIFAVTETWLKSHVSNTSVSIPGYKFCRNDRLEGRSGGVGIYVSSKFHYRPVNVESHYGECEVLFIEVDIGNCTVLFGVVYLPKGNINIFENLAGDIFEKYSNIIIVGDFNNNLFNPSKSAYFRNVCNSFNLSVIHNNIPTYFDVQHGSTSLLDLFLVSNPSILNSSNQVQCPFISHHSLIFASFNFQLPRNQDCVNSYREYRDYSSMDIDGMVAYMNNSDISMIYNTNDINCQVEKLDSLISTLFSYVPVSKYRLKKNTINWVNSGSVIYSKSLRDISYKAYMRNKSDANWKTFCKFRNRTKRVMRNARKGHYSTKFENSNTREMWNHLRAAGLETTDSAINQLDVDQINYYFCAHEHNRVGSTQDIENLICNNSRRMFSFTRFTILDVYTAFNKIKTNACGVDDIPFKFYKLILPLISRHILHIYNSIVTTSIYPDRWKCSKVIPIPKTGSDYALNNLRPISILPALSRVFEHIISGQINQYIFQNSLLDDRQSGFRKNCNTSAVLLGITELIREKINLNINCILVSLDLSKAFDRLDHVKMVEKLSSEFKFDRNSCRLIYSYLRDREQFVCLNGARSHRNRINSGVAQGSVLGPLLFSMYLNNIFSLNTFNSYEMYAYADDIQLLFFDNQSTATIQNVINHTLQTVESWMQFNGLCINLSKTKMMKFGNSLPDNILIQISGTRIEFVDRLKVLGVVLDEKLSYTFHINKICANVNFTLRRLYSLNLYLPYHVRFKVAHALLMSQLSYCLDVYSCTSLGNLGKIKLLINKIVRFVFNLKRREHVSVFVARFLGCSFSNFLNIKLLISFYRIVKSSTPNYMVQPIHFIHSSRNIQIFIPRISTSLFEKSFIVKSARIWNNLPASLRLFHFSILNYRSKLFQYYNM